MSVSFSQYNLNTSHENLIKFEQICADMCEFLKRGWAKNMDFEKIVRVVSLGGVGDRV